MFCSAASGSRIDSALAQLQLEKLEIVSWQRLVNDPWYSRNSFPTPMYGYGWVISCTELFEGLHKKPCHESRRLEGVVETAESRFKSAWTKSGYNNNNYR